MKVTVEIMTGTCIDTEVNEDETVRNLKEKIAAELNFPAKRLILLVGENERRRIVMDGEDEMLLLDLGVKDESHMYLFFKPLDLVSCQERPKGEGDGNKGDKEEEAKEEEEEDEYEVKQKEEAKGVEQIENNGNEMVSKEEEDSNSL